MKSDRKHIEAQYESQPFEYKAVGVQLLHLGKFAAGNDPARLLQWLASEKTWVKFAPLAASEF